MHLLEMVIASTVIYDLALFAALHAPATASSTTAVAVCLILLVAMQSFYCSSGGL